MDPDLSLGLPGLPEFGLGELKAVLLAVAIISVWAALRYGRASRREDDPST